MCLCDGPLLQVAGLKLAPLKKDREGVHFFGRSTGAMSGLHSSVTMGLVLLMCALTNHCGESAPTAAPTVSGRDAQSLRRTADVLKHVEESRGRSRAETVSPRTSPAREPSAEPRDLRNLKSDRGDQIIGELRVDIWAAGVDFRGIKGKGGALGHTLLSPTS